MHPVCLTRLAPKRFGGQTESREKARSAPPTLVVSAAKKHAGGRRGGWHFFAMHPRPDLHAPPTVALHPVTAANRHRVSSGAGARRQRERALHRVTTLAGRAAADPLTATRRREKLPSSCCVLPYCRYLLLKNVESRNDPASVTMTSFTPYKQPLWGAGWAAPGRLATYRATDMMFIKRVTCYV